MPLAMNGKTHYWLLQKSPIGNSQSNRRTTRTAPHKTLFVLSGNACNITPSFLFCLKMKCPNALPLRVGERRAQGGTENHQEKERQRRWHVFGTEAVSFINLRGLLSTFYFILFFFLGSFFNLLGVIFNFALRFNFNPSDQYVQLSWKSVYLSLYFFCPFLFN